MRMSSQALDPPEDPQGQQQPPPPPTQQSQFIPVNATVPIRATTPLVYVVVLYYFSRVNTSEFDARFRELGDDDGYNDSDSDPLARGTKQLFCGFREMTHANHCLKMLAAERTGADYRYTEHRQWLNFHDEPEYRPRNHLGFTGELRYLYRGDGRMRADCNCDGERFIIDVLACRPDDLEIAGLTIY